MSLSSAGRAVFAISMLASAWNVVLSPAQADSGTIRFSLIKAGLVIGGSGGSGTLIFRGGAMGSHSVASAMGSPSVPRKRTLAELLVTSAGPGR